MKLVEWKSISLELAQKAVDGVIAQAEQDGREPVAIAVTDARGDLVAFARMDGDGDFSGTVARRKAYTAVRIATDTGAWRDRITGQGRTVSDYREPDLIPFQGGVAIRVDGQIVGGIAVSGRNGPEDEELARLGLRHAGFEA
ncbi:MAG: heme-binding protein [Nocardioides sp.]|uniref:GlcG/HbpS family heme-binding protein n=1 Tax=Nocardioides sp. TaxID=35761 RepID=UPI0039E3655F